MLGYSVASHTERERIRASRGEDRNLRERPHRHLFLTLGGEFVINLAHRDGSADPEVMLGVPAPAYRIRAGGLAPWPRQLPSKPCRPLRAVLFYHATACNVSHHPSQKLGIGTPSTMCGIALKQVIVLYSQNARPTGVCKING